MSWVELIVQAARLQMYSGPFGPAAIHPQMGTVSASGLASSESSLRAQWHQQTAQPSKGIPFTWLRR